MSCCDVRAVVVIIYVVLLGSSLDVLVLFSALCQ